MTNYSINAYQITRLIRGYCRNSSWLLIDPVIFSRHVFGFSATHSASYAVMDRYSGSSIRIIRHRNRDSWIPATGNQAPIATQWRRVFWRWTPGCSSFRFSNEPRFGTPNGDNDWFQGGRGAVSSWRLGNYLRNLQGIAALYDVNSIIGLVSCVIVDKLHWCLVIMTR
jgi:hypothetical protein